MTHSAVWCMIKIFRGESKGCDTFKIPSPYEQLLPLPTLVLRYFKKDPLMTPTTTLQALFTATHCYHKNLNHTLGAIFPFRNKTKILKC